MTTIIGCDYSFARPDPAAMARAGVRWAGRYGSRDPHNLKNYTPAEGHRLAAAGIAVVCLWEGTGLEPLGGKPAGISEATAARAFWDAAGAPADAPIYLAADFNPDPSQDQLVVDFFEGAATVTDARAYAVRPILDLLDDGGHNREHWQSASLAAGMVSVGAGIVQRVGGAPVPGTDLDVAITAAFGAWMPDQPQPVEAEPVNVAPWGNILTAARPTTAGGVEYSHQTAPNAAWLPWLAMAPPPGTVTEAGTVAAPQGGSLCVWVLLSDGRTLATILDAQGHWSGWLPMIPDG